MALMCQWSCCKKIAAAFYQRGHLMLMCLLMTAITFMVVLSVSLSVQLGWRQTAHQWYMSVQQSFLMLALDTLGQHPLAWAGQPCVHPPLQWPDIILFNERRWQTLTPCQIMIAEQPVYWIMEMLVPETAYRLTVKSASFMQQLTVIVDEQGQARRQAWRNVL